MDNYLAKLQDVAYYRSSPCFNGSVTSPIDNLSIFLTTPLAILACMATVAANVLLALVTTWAIAYVGVFILGFGGARWTSDIALNYFRNVAGIGLKLMTMTLLLGIAVSIIDDYHADLAAKASMDELLVIFVVSLVLVILINTIPNVMAGLIAGGVAASAGSSFGAGAIMGAGMAAAGMATGGAALAGKAAMGAAAGAAGGASAIQAAFQKASASMGESGGDMLADVMGGGDEGGSALASAMGGGDAGTGDTPFAQAGGFGGGESGSGSDSAGLSSSDSSSSGGDTAAGGESSSRSSGGAAVQQNWPLVRLANWPRVLAASYRQAFKSESAKRQAVSWQHQFAKAWSQKKPVSSRVTAWAAA